MNRQAQPLMKISIVKIAGMRNRRLKHVECTNKSIVVCLRFCRLVLGTRMQNLCN